LRVQIPVKRRNAHLSMCWSVTGSSRPEERRARRKRLTTLHFLCFDARTSLPKETSMERFRRPASVVGTAILLAFVFITAASAQTATGGLRGFVKDGTGAVLVGVTVEAASPA